MNGDKSNQGDKQEQRSENTPAENTEILFSGMQPGTKFPTAKQTLSIGDFQTDSETAGLEPTNPETEKSHVAPSTEISHRDPLRDMKGVENSHKTAPTSTEFHLNIQSRLLSAPQEATVDSSTMMDYQIVRKLGEGGMGQVWLAYQTSLGRQVAVKQIRGEHLSELTLTQSQSVTQNFLTEAVVTGELNHPNIIPIYDMGTDLAGNLLYSMKAVQGVSWDHVIHSKSEAENIEILRKVADAIAFAHSRGVVNRDLKPANIMVGSYGEVLVMDWGLALPMPNFTKIAGIRCTPSPAGTPAYMPPEQGMTDLNLIGPHSDIYLLGAILFEIVAGCPPHPVMGRTGEQLKSKQLIENIRTNRIVETSVSGELVDIALKAMQTDPINRFTSVDAFIEILKNYQKHAESVVIVQQASKVLDEANLSQDNLMYARALHSFENALSLWDANIDAKRGVMDTRLDWARSALHKQEFDQGLSLVNIDHPAYKATYKKLIAGKRERNKREFRLRIMKWAVTFLLISMCFGGLYSYFLINEEKDNAIEALKAAEIAKNEEEIAKDKVQVALRVVTDEKNKADRARESEEEAKDKALIETKKANKAKDEEVKARTQAIREWYYSQINLADQQVSQNAFDSARATLKKIEIRLNDEKIQSNLAGSGATRENNLAAEIGTEFERLNYVCGLADDQLNFKNLGRNRIALTAVAAHPSLIATANLQSEIQLWGTGKPRENLHTFFSPSGTTASALAISPDAKTLAVGDTSGGITIWDCNTGKAGQELRGHLDHVTRLIYLPEGQLVSTSHDHAVIVWDVIRGTPTKLNAHPKAVLSLAVVTNQDQKTIALVSGDSHRGEVRLWPEKLLLGKRSETKSKLLRGDESTAITSLAGKLKNPGAEDELMIFVGKEDGRIKAIEFSQKTQEVIKSYSVDREMSERHRGAVTAILIDPNDPNRLISTSRDNTVRTWNVTQSTLEIEEQSLLQDIFRGHGNAIVDAAVWKEGPDDLTQLLTVSTDGTARFWRPDQNPEMISLGGSTLDRKPGTYGEVFSLSAGGPNGNQIMGVSIDGFATIWNGADQNAKPFRQAPMSLHEGHRYLTQAAVFMKGAIATTSFDGTAVVWDRDTGSMIAQFPEVGITGVLAGSVDGKWLITGYSPSDKTGIQSTAIEENPANLQIWSLAAFRNARPTVPAPDEFRTRIAVGKQDFNEETNVPIPDSPFSIAISPEGRWGLVGTDHGYLNLIDLQTKQSSPAIAAHLGSADSDPPTPEGVTGVAFLSETDSVTAGLNGIIRFWKIQNGLLVEHPTRKPYVHTNGSVVHRVIGLVASTEGSRIATRLLQRTPNPPEFRPIWLHHVTADGVQLIDKLPRPIAGSDERNEKILSISLDSDGTRLLAAVAASKSDEPKKSQSVLREWILTPSSVSESEDVLKSARGFDFEQALYVPGESDRIAFLSNRIVSIRKRTDTKAFDKHPSEDFGPTVALQACDLSIDGTLAVTTSDFLAANDEQPGDARNSIPRLRGEIRIWKIAGSTGTRVYGRQISATATVAMSPVDPRLILVGGAISDPSRQDQPENAAVLYRWSEKELVFVQRLECELGADRIIRGRFSRDGKRIVTATREGHVEVFEHDGAIFKSIHRVDLCTKDSPLRLGSLIAVDLNDQGQLILAADKNSVLVIDAETGKPLVEDLISGHSGDITEVRFAIPEVGQEHSPKRFWTASMDGTTKLWGLTTGKSKTANLPDTEMLDSRLLLTLRGHRQGVVALTALPKGGVVTASKDGQVIKWPIKPRTESKSADQTYEKR